MKPLIQTCVSLCPCTWGPVYTGEITSRINHNSYKQSQIQVSRYEHVSAVRFHPNL